MYRKFSFVCLVILLAAALSLVISCEADILTQLMVPEGNLIPDTGYPLGSQPTEPILAKDTHIPAFDINNLPSPEWWNSQPEMIALPNPFAFADQTLITSPIDWPRRREEIQKILEYYYTGDFPPLPIKVEISGAGATGAGDLVCSVTVLVDGVERTQNTTFTGLWIPVNAPNGLPVSTTNKAPLLISVGATTTAYRNNGYATISINANSDSLTGFAQQIYGYDITSDTRPSGLLQEAWKAGIILDAIEAGAGGGVLDPELTMISGMSRWGKEALWAGAFARSMTGRQIGVSNPVSAGGGGVSVDRFMAVPSKSPLYIKSINTVGGTALGIVVLPDEGGAANTTNTQAESIYIAGYYWDSFPVSGSPWFGKRLFDFADTHHDWNVDRKTGDYGRGGIISMAPFDAHFMTSLIAPRGLLIHEGWNTNRGNAESNYMNYLATKEVYDFLEAPGNIGIRIYTITHSNPTREQYDLIDFANQYFNRKYPGLNYARIEGQATYPVLELESFQDADPEFGGDKIATWFDERSVDPEGDNVYMKLYWASPSKPEGSSVGDQVKKYFDDNGIDYKK
jgi:hypothetical protein